MSVLPDFLTTREVADLIRLKERKVYDLVAAGQIPCIRVTGKLLFPRALVEAWLMRHADYAGSLETLAPRPPICAGSHDPLLEWALREARTGIAVGFGGSLDGLAQMAKGEALIAGLHVPEPQGEWNVATIKERLFGRPFVLIEWARRTQGLVVARGNPRKVSSVRDLRKRRVVIRQPEAGSYMLFTMELEKAQLALADLDLAREPALTEADVAAAILEGRADAGLGIAAVAKQYGLGFVPLIEERYDVLVPRAAYFEAPFQKLIAFSRSERFADKAAALGGYDTSRLGEVRYNAT